MKEIEMENQARTKWGGFRPGAGRRKGDRTKGISVNISPEAYEIYRTWGNKSEKIDGLIKLAKQE